MVMHGMSQARKRKARTLVPAEQDAAAILRASITPACFWPPEQLGPQPAWLQHAPFAFWLIETLRPRLLVELGTHGGYSYFAFCQAVQRLQLDARCYAVDTWKGDEHAGLYGEEVYEEVRAHNDRLYSAFSTLIRSSFDQALSHFTDGTIDLLHVDGRHFYEDVRQDFEAWRPKLSNRSVVLFHDTNVRERDFGVFKLWEELRAAYPHFEFVHGHGLGVLGIGRKLPNAVAKLFLLAEREAATSQIRNAYARLGSAISLELATRRQADEIAARTAESETLRQGLQARAAETVRLGEELKCVNVKRAELATTVAALSADFVRLGEQFKAAEHRAAKLCIELRTADTRADELGVELVAANNRAAKLGLEFEAANNRAAKLGIELATANNRATQLGMELEMRSAEVSRLTADLTTTRSAVTELEREAALRKTALSTAKMQLETELAMTRAQAVQRNADLVDTRRRLSELTGTLEERSRELHSLRASASWRVTKPLRLFATKFPWLSRQVWRIAKVAWWCLTLQIATRLHSLWRRRRYTDLIASSGLFDEAWYREHYPDISGSARELARHYLVFGGLEGRDPSPLFDSDWYLEQNPDVHAAGVNPLVHYLLYGAAEGREPRRPASHQPKRMAAQ